MKNVLKLANKTEAQLWYICNNCFYLPKKIPSKKDDINQEIYFVK